MPENPLFINCKNNSYNRYFDKNAKKFYINHDDSYINYLRKKLTNLTNYRKSINILFDKYGNIIFEYKNRIFLNNNPFINSLNENDKNDKKNIFPVSSILFNQDESDFGR